MNTPGGDVIIDLGEPLSQEQLARRLSFDDSELFIEHDKERIMNDQSFNGFDYFDTCRSVPKEKSRTMDPQNFPSSCPPFMMPMPLNLRTFHGYNQEDAEKFLNDFIAFSKMSGFDEDRMVSAFSLYLAGPAYNWYKTLDGDTQRDWPLLKQKFVHSYATANEAVLYSELQLYNELTLDDKNLEDYYSEILKRGRRLKKSEPDMMTKFIDGLPSSLKFFVRAGRPASLGDAMQSARMGDACGYRKGVGQTQVPTAKTPIVCAAERKDDQRLQKIEHQLDAVMQSLSKIQIPAVQGMENQVSRPLPRRECHKCSGKGHFKNKCKWTGNGPKSPETQCQICGQYGHSAKMCADLVQGNALHENAPQGNMMLPGEMRPRLGP